MVPSPKMFIIQKIVSAFIGAVVVAVVYWKRLLRRAKH
jgi:uncharacterized membrane protein YeaQ/YmgE (transglycosylase-associated protein family)